MIKGNKNKNKNPPLKKNKKKFKKLDNDKICGSNSNIRLKNQNILVNVNKKQNFNITIFNIDGKRKKDFQNINYNDYEFNNISYKDALNKDKRTYMQYYCSLLRLKHLLIFTFYTYTDYNSKIIKISLFLFTFSLYYTINALFFTDSTIHEIYEDKGIFIFINQIPKILYSTIISSVIIFIVKFLSLSEKDIIKVKKMKKM